MKTLCDQENNNLLLQEAASFAYRKRFASDGLDNRNRLWSVLCRNYFQRYIRETDTVLDLGCGYCEFVNNICCAKKYALDINPDVVVYARPGVTVKIMEADSVGYHFPEVFDVAFASNFFEHLPSKDAVTRVAESVKASLKPGGIFVVLQPDISLVGPSYWNYFDHQIPLTSDSLVEMFLSTGWHIVKVKRRFLPYTMKGKRLLVSGLFIKAYLKVPVVQWLFGKQCLIVARKPA